ncbi:hypothetical protein RN001_009772 [Aquatica leii]|uniref:Letm1 RBD domain-containing protein n=1 Tax=Aquatica leii TaxID=1421715 RepID=A0AAN7P964_9COLE|nr:hypothetical protein RN001_009772 [Aquatica leii]
MSFRILINIYNLEKKRLLKTPTIYSSHVRCIYLKHTPSKKSIYKTEEAKKIRFYILDRCFEYFKTYNAFLEKKFPRAMRVYRLFMDGMKDFFKDFKEYIKIVHSLNISGKSLNDLTLKEIELYQQMPKDMRRIAPFLIVSLLPFANYVSFPIAYYFPRQILCRHFWNLQQISEFSVIFLQKRLSHNKPVFRHLQFQLPNLEGVLHEKWSKVLGTIGSGLHPHPYNILECKELFETGPYHLQYLSSNHVKHLSKMHEVPMGWFRRTRLGDRAIILQAMDRKIMQQGIEKLPQDVLRNACLFRGLSPVNMKNEDMVAWLNKWIIISCAVNKNSLSLLLHCPILLAYNEPTNWQLIYRRKTDF